MQASVDSKGGNSPRPEATPTSQIGDGGSNPPCRISLRLCSDRQDFEAFRFIINQYHHVIKAARKPVLVRGGGRVSDEEILTRTKELMKQGAAGIVYGRNVIQHKNPKAMTSALMAVVHKDASVADALKILKS